MLLAWERNETARTRIIEGDAVGACTSTGVKISALDRLCWNWQTRQSPDLRGPLVDEVVTPSAAGKLPIAEEAVALEVLGDRFPCRCASPAVEP